MAILLEETMKQKQDKAKWIQEAVERHEGELLRYALRLLKNIERAREVVQETFLRLWKIKPEKVEGHLRPWLFKVCRNLSFDILRRDKKMENIENEQLVADPAAKDLDKEILKKTRMYTVKDAIGMLSRKQQEVLVLKFQNDLSYKEISEITGLSVSNVGYLIHEGIQNLKNKLHA